MKAAKTSGSVKLAASTKIKLDGDSDTFYETDIPQTLLTTHKKESKLFGG